MSVRLFQDSEAEPELDRQHLEKTLSWKEHLLRESQRAISGSERNNPPESSKPRKALTQGCARGWFEIFGGGVYTNKTMSKGLGEFPTSTRIAITFFLFVAIYGYFSALSSIYFGHRLADGKEGLSFDDLKAVFHGTGKSKLVAMLEGPMKRFLPDKEGRRRIIQWVQRGATEEAFESAPGSKESISDILFSNCLRCHSEGGEAGHTLLTTHEEVVEVAKKIDRGMEPRHLSIMLHTHIIGIGILLSLLAVVFSLTGLAERLKLVLIVLLFLALFGDLTSWILARYSVAFVYLIALCGGGDGAEHCLAHPPPAR